MAADNWANQSTISQSTSQKPILIVSHLSLASKVASVHKLSKQNSAPKQQADMIIPAIKHSYL